MVRDPMNTPVHAVRHTGLPSACTRRKLTERREVYGVRDPEEIGPCSFSPLERGPSVPVPQDLPSWLYPCFLAHPVSFPFRVSPQHPLVSSRFLSSFPRKLRGNQLVWAQNQPKRQNTGVYLEITLRPAGYFAELLGFASDFAPDQLSDSGKLESCQNGAPNTL